MKQTKLIRATFVDFKDSELIIKTLTNEILKISCNEEQISELNLLKSFLNSSTHLNLLNIVETKTNNSTEFFVLEPDYLLDVSSLSECFKPYGNHPLNYALSRLLNRQITSPILLGNSANFFIDELINQDNNHPAEYITLLKKLFHTAAFEFSVCEDLKSKNKEDDFFRNCYKHYLNIEKAINSLFIKAGIHKEKIILEPSFISNTLGLQGRMDILLSDYSALIELKSGKAIEDFRTGGQFIKSAENHYCQMILYSAILEFNMDLSPEDISSYLLYSKYPVLSKERHSTGQLQTALRIRNQIVAYEYVIQSSNNINVTREVIEKINSSCLNIKQLTGNFFDNYLEPSINSFHKSYLHLNELEKIYFLRLYTFITKELWLSKVGEKEYEGIRKASVLWNASLEDKLIAGEILYNLSIIENKSSGEEHTITLFIPPYKDLYLPNFRQGDSIVLYERNMDRDTVNNRQVFKGSIESIQSDCIKIRLRYRQKNTSVWHPTSTYAIEHDYMDTTYTGMFRALTTFINANQDRKDLLLCQSIPKDEPECFLLVGPPGTGKTSVFLKNKVENHLKEEKGNILLLSYTNRAVDEICKALTSISENIQYIRIGNQLNCDPEYRKNLLENRMESCSNRKEVIEAIDKCRIFAGTVASVWNKSDLFRLKQFDLCIIDEATQLLEPHLLGILCAKTSSGANAVSRFI